MVAFSPAFAARLAGTPEPHATTLEAYQGIFGKGGDLPRGDFPLPMVVRFSRQGWGETVKQLADALSAIIASLNKIGHSQGSIRVQEVIVVSRVDLPQRPTRLR